MDASFKGIMHEFYESAILHAVKATFWVINANWVCRIWCNF